MMVVAAGYIWMLQGMVNDESPSLAVTDGGTVITGSSGGSWDGGDQRTVGWYVRTRP